MTIYFRFPQNRPYKAVWGIFLFLMQSHKKSMIPSIKSLDLFELICDYPYIVHRSTMQDGSRQAILRPKSRKREKRLVGMLLFCIFVSA